MNIQTICDSSMKIQDIVARWPGSTHDVTIFNQSRVCQRLEVGEFGNGLIVADMGYDVRSYLIPPLRETRVQPEILFNESQIRTRNVVERSYGVWKRRFPILALCLRLSINHCEAVVVETAVLHNMACDMSLEVPPIDPGLLEQMLPIIDPLLGAPVQPERVRSDAVRRQLVTYFEG